MTPQQFISKWQASPLTERAAAQSQFIDLCRLLDEPIPSDADPTGTWYAFEKGAIKATGALGWADVWKKEHFAWEYKKPNRDLSAAFSQLQQYAGALGNPPLLVVSDMLRFRVHTNWTNTVTQVDEIVLEQLIDPGKRQVLKCVLSNPERLKPGLTRQALTEQAAEKFADLARRLRQRGHNPERVAHFVNRLVFCMFAEDVDLLPNKIFEEMVETGCKFPERFPQMASELFVAMRSGGSARWESIEWFNGGLFNDDEALPLERNDLTEVLAAAKLDWAEIDPSIFGTLFERGLDPDKRSQLGAHYTDRDKIMLIIEPVIVRPWLAEWETVKVSIAGHMAVVAEARARRPGQSGEAHVLPIQDDNLTAEVPPRRSMLQSTLRLKYRSTSEHNPQRDNGPKKGFYRLHPIALARRPSKQSEAKKVYATARRAEETARRAARTAFNTFIERLRAFRVLDPACGSGNFLYLALLALKDIEHRANIEAEVLGLERETPTIGPESVMGIEINPYAAELARISVWIGEIQWMRRNGFGIRKNPILRSLETIECRDALVNPDGSEVSWPASDAIVGNPPFLGDKMMISRLGETYVRQLRSAYKDCLPGGADLVCYWFAIADQMIRKGHAHRAGFVSTNSIRGGANRTVLDHIRSHHAITDAWADEEWTVDGAAVRVSLVCFTRRDRSDKDIYLDGLPVSEVFADLTSGTSDVTKVKRLPENKMVCFIGRQKDGPIDIPESLAHQLISAPINPNGRQNTDVVHPWMNGADITRRSSGRWIIDFKEMDKAEACIYEAPFEYLRLKALGPEGPSFRFGGRQFPAFTSSGGSAGKAVAVPGPEGPGLATAGNQI